MKTTKFFSALSFAMIFSAATFAATIGGVTKNDPISINPVVNHHVNVNLTIDKRICNWYLVEILDGQGRLVAPAKNYVPGVSAYDFYERGPASGVRIAVLVLAPMNSHFIYRLLASYVDCLKFIQIISPYLDLRYTTYDLMLFYQR